MINKVDGNHYNVYTQQKSLKIPSAGEKFNLDLKRDELASGDKTERGLSEEAGRQEEQLGVKLELSDNGRAASHERQEQTAKTQESGKKGQYVLLENIQDFVSKILVAVQNFLHRIWDSPPEEPAVQELQEAMEPAVVISELESVPIEEEDVVPVEEGDDFPMDEASRDRQIQQSLRSGNLSQAISFLTENGKRTLAKNSTLLTSYDKNGRIVETSASDRQRVLYGDKNSLKL